MYRLMTAGFVIFLAMSGCASTKSTRGSAAPQPATPASQPATPPASQPVTPPAVRSDAESPAERPTERLTGEPPEKPPEISPKAAAAASPVSGAPAPSAAKTKSPADARPGKQADTTGAPRAPAVQTPASNAAPTPTLDLAALEQRLRDTHAIGVFTKLSLKNQVDDLLGEFRALYQSQDKHPPAELRQRYDQLLLKVLGLLQGGDPSLAAAIASSREAIWSILSDPEKFAKI
jgi:hypothetical protein